MKHSKKKSNKEKYKKNTVNSLGTNFCTIVKSEFLVIGFAGKEIYKGQIIADDDKKIKSWTRGKKNPQ